MDKKLFNRVLILDDDPASLYLARLMLIETGIAEEIATFQTAKEGLEFVKTHCLDEHAAKEDCPDLILLDINMPGMDGFDFLDALEILGKKHLIRRVVVVLTSSSYPRDQERMQAYGVRSFLVKPITEEKIMELVAAGGQLTGPFHRSAAWNMGSLAKKRVKHNINHTYTNIEGHDADLEVGPLLRLHANQPRYWFHRFQHAYQVFQYGLSYVSWVFYQDFAKYFSGNIDPEHPYPALSRRELRLVRR